jgi:hypothetical protein
MVDTRVKALRWEKWHLAACAAMARVLCMSSFTMPDIPAHEFPSGARWHESWKHAFTANQQDQIGAVKLLSSSSGSR